MLQMKMSHKPVKQQCLLSPEADCRLLPGDELTCQICENEIDLIEHDSEGHENVHLKMWEGMDDFYKLKWKLLGMRNIWNIKHWIKV